jgi:predicted secreted hydrolase
MINRRSLVFALFIFLPLAARADWQFAKPGWNYQFPEDHYSHPSFKTEWWYFTGNLRATNGEEFGYQLTFFRQGIADPSRALPPSRFVQRDVKFAHFAVSDISRKKFHHFQKLSRGAFGESGFDDGSRIAWIEDWSCEPTGVNDFHLRATEEGVSLDLKLTSTRSLVLHGSNGISQKAEGEGGLRIITHLPACSRRACSRYKEWNTPSRA